MLEIESAVVVIVFFLKHTCFCGRLVDSNYFYTEESIPCTYFCVRVMPFVCMLSARSYHSCMQFVKACIYIRGLTSLNL